MAVGEDPGPACIEGDTEACECDAGTPGLRQCGSDAAYGKCMCDPLCGNGVLEPGEECDDGNITPFDGCSNQCVKEFDPVTLDIELPPLLFPTITRTPLGRLALLRADRTLEIRDDAGEVLSETPFPTIPALHPKHDAGLDPLGQDLVLFSLNGCFPVARGCRNEWVQFGHDGGVVEQVSFATALYPDFQPMVLATEGDSIFALGRVQAGARKPAQWSLQRRNRQAQVTWISMLDDPLSNVAITMLSDGHIAILDAPPGPDPSRLLVFDTDAVPLPDVQLPPNQVQHVVANGFGDLYTLHDGDTEREGQLLYALDEDGTQRWSTSLFDKVLSLAALPDGGVAVAANRPYADPPWSSITLFTASGTVAFRHEFERFGALALEPTEDGTVYGLMRRGFDDQTVDLIRIDPEL